ncbi:hypothetical protein K8R42_03060 [bacterium]|nr:hypothetical protein [bacterium]
MKTIASLDVALARVTKLLRVLREAGLKDEVLDQPVNDKSLRQRLMNFWNGGCYDPLESLRFALRLEGSLDDLTNSVMVYVPAMSIMEMHQQFPDTFAFATEAEAYDKKHWYGDEKFANDPGEDGWCLVNRGGSDKPARILAYAMIAYAIQTGQKFLILKDGCTRTLDHATNGQMVSVSHKGKQSRIEISRFGMTSMNI